MSFECADIVEFEPTVYTTSVTSGGVPVGLSLNERSRSRRRLDSYEMERESEYVPGSNAGLIEIQSTALYRRLRIAC